MFKIGRAKGMVSTSLVRLTTRTMGSRDGEAARCQVPGASSNSSRSWRRTRSRA